MISLFRVYTGCPRDKENRKHIIILVLRVNELHISPPSPHQTQIIYIFLITLKIKQKKQKEKKVF